MIKRNGETAKVDKTHCETVLGGHCWDQYYPDKDGNLRQDATVGRECRHCGACQERKPVFSQGDFKAIN